MKKNLILTACLVMATAFITSCNKDDNPTEAKLNVDNAAPAAAAAAGGTVTFNVTSDSDWSISKPADATWITSIVPQSGSGDAAITVTLASSADAARSAVLTLTAGKTTKNVTISQAAGVAGPPAPQVINLGDGSNGYEITANMTLSYPNTYILKGFVYVITGATLTIEPGVIIKGETASKGTLIIERGGKIMAEGTKEKPIVFTSQEIPGKRVPGDWGGIIILGNASNNLGTVTIEGGVRSQHGGLNDDDNSGVLSYVRVEFAGIEYGTDNEINGITFGSVGRGTQVDHIQVSHSGDDSYEWFGGTVNAKYIVAYSTWDDDFDTDNGFVGNIQYGLIVRNPLVADKSTSNGFESDNNSDGAPIARFTSPVFANISSFGPVVNPATYIDEGTNKGSAALTTAFQAGVQIRRSSRLNLFNSVIAGWPIGLIIEDDKTGSTSQESATAGDLVVSNVVLAGMQHNFQDKATNLNPVYSLANGDTFVNNYFNNVATGNSTYPEIANLNLSAATGLSTSVIPSGTSPLLTGATWTDTKTAASFSWAAGQAATGFDKVNYIGAFGPNDTADDNWMSGWTNFDPQNTAY